MKVKNRVKELRLVRAKDLHPNPKNWRTHPREQADALRGILAEVGYADAIKAIETDDGLMIVDGHLRAETTPDMEVPVLILDLTLEEADKVLATHDVVTMMAGRDEKKLHELLAGVTFQSQAIGAMLENIAGPEAWQAVSPSEKKLLLEPDVSAGMTVELDEALARAVRELSEKLDLGPIEVISNAIVNYQHLLAKEH
jgi:hypothetical protein